MDFIIIINYYYHYPVLVVYEKTVSLTAAQLKASFCDTGEITFICILFANKTTTRSCKVGFVSLLLANGRMNTAVVFGAKPRSRFDTERLTTQDKVCFCSPFCFP